MAKAEILLGGYGEGSADFVVIKHADPDLCLNCDLYKGFVEGIYCQLRSPGVNMANSGRSKYLREWREILGKAACKPEEEVTDGR
jgi:hypothetical protein